MHTASEGVHNIGDKESMSPWTKWRVSRRFEPCGSNLRGFSPALAHNGAHLRVCPGCPGIFTGLFEALVLVLL